MQYTGCNTVVIIHLVLIRRRQKNASSVEQYVSPDLAVAHPLSLTIYDIIQIYAQPLYGNSDYRPFSHYQLDWYDSSTSLAHFSPTHLVTDSSQTRAAVIPRE